MAGLLVFLALPLATIALRRSGVARGWREAAVFAAVAWGGVAVVAAEILGAFAGWRFWPTLLGWLACDGLLAWAAFRGREPWIRPRLSRFGAGCLAIVSALLVLSGLAAVAAPPNTPDVLSYHLPRQVYWLQQGSLAHFITANDRALMMPPGAEILQAHALLLTGTDAWANIPQWIAYALGMIVASLLVREWGGGPRVQGLAAAIFATLPMAYHEASSAKNDLLVAVWLGAFAWLAWRLMARERAPVGEWLAAGAALGLALVTKPTALLFALPLGLLLAAAARRRPWAAAGLLALALALPAPHAWRNQEWYGTPLGVHRAEDGGAAAVASLSLRGTLSNAMRNATLHLATPSQAANAALFHAVARGHRGIGVDPNDRRFTLWTLPYAITWEPASEPSAGAPAHLLLGLAAAVWLLVRRPSRAAVQALFALAAGALVFCAALKWQPWGARLQLPLFLLSAPVVALAAGGWGRWGVAAAGGLCCLAWLPSAETETRPLWTAPSVFARSRWENYFRVNPDERRYTETALRALEVAEVRSLQVVTRHGFPHPLLPRYLALGGRRELWGTLPDAGRGPPEGVLVLEPFERPRPQFISPPGARERYRAAGALDPWALYLPESRAKALALPLPRFIGWVRLEGFEPRGDPVPGATAYRLAGAAGKIVFAGGAVRMAVRMEFVNRSGQAGRLEIRREGAITAAADVRADTAPQVLAAEFPSGEPHGELMVEITPALAPHVDFSALQITDALAPPAR